MPNNYIQPPLPGMGKDKVLEKVRKKKTLTQPALPGLGDASVKKLGLRKKASKPEVSETPVEKPKRQRKQSELQTSLSKGQLPLAGMMTGGEIMKHFNLADAGYNRVGTMGENKPAKQRGREVKMMSRKLREAKTGMASDTRREIIDESGEPSLISSLRSSGGLKVDKNTRLPVVDADAGSDKTRPTLIDGHHRVAAMNYLNKNQFVPFRYDDWEPPKNNTWI